MSNEIGVAASVRVQHLIADEDITFKMNDWLSDNPDVEIIDIKFTTSATAENWSADALIVYRKEIY